MTHSYYNGRNFFYILAKDVPGDLWRRYWPRMLKAQLRITFDALRAWRGREARARLRGQLAGLWHFPRMLSRRRAVQSRRTAMPAQSRDHMARATLRSCVEGARLVPPCGTARLYHVRGSSDATAVFWKSGALRVVGEATRVPRCGRAAL